MSELSTQERSPKERKAHLRLVHDARKPSIRISTGKTIKLDGHDLPESDCLIIFGLVDYEQVFGSDALKPYGPDPKHVCYCDAYEGITCSYHRARGW